MNRLQVSDEKLAEMINMGKYKICFVFTTLLAG